MDALIYSGIFVVAGIISTIITMFALAFAEHNDLYVYVFSFILLNIFMIKIFTGIELP